jgi:hypothetical protein
MPGSSIRLFEFEEESMSRESNDSSTQMYGGYEDGFRIMVKSINLFSGLNTADCEKAIETFMNLRHPCIAGTIRVVLPSQLQGLRIVRKYLEGPSLPEVNSISPGWWTPTAKAKAVVGLIFGLRFVHGLGLLHGHLTGNNVVFDEDGVIQITDFCLNNLGACERNEDTKTEVQGFSGENWTPQADIQAFASIFSEIVIGASPQQGGRRPIVPSFVSEIIEREQSADSKACGSLTKIFETLEWYEFQIIEGVDSREVSNYVDWIERSQTLI